MGQTVEQQRRRDGKITRKVDVPGAIDRRLVHHARVRRIPLERIIRNALIRECHLLDRLEAETAEPRSGVVTATAAEG